MRKTILFAIAAALLGTAAAVQASDRTQSNPGAASQITRTAVNDDSRADDRHERAGRHRERHDESHERRHGSRDGHHDEAKEHADRR